MQHEPFATLIRAVAIINLTAPMRDLINLELSTFRYFESISVLIRK